MTFLFCFVLRSQAAAGGEAAGFADASRWPVPPVPASAPRVIFASIMAGGAT